MAGHYLKTVNPEAADAIRPDVTMAGPAPGIGDVVLYYPRPGEGSGGRITFPMLVTQVQEDGRIGGIAFIDVSDFRSVTPGVWQRTETNPWPAWDWMQSRAAAPDTGDMADTVRALLDRADAQEAIVAERLEQTLDLVAAKVEVAVGHVRGVIDPITSAVSTVEYSLDNMREALNTTTRSVDAITARVQALEELLGIGSEPKQQPRRRK